MIVKADCSIQDCPNISYSRTWCAKHYNRWWRYGDPNTVHVKGSKYRLREFIIFYRDGGGMRIKKIRRNSKEQAVIAFLDMNEEVEVLGIGRDDEAVVWLRQPFWE